MKTKYGEIPPQQVASAKSKIQKSIFHLLLYVDPIESIKFQNVDVNEAFQSVFTQLMGFNKILLEPPEVVLTMDLLEVALDLYNSDDFCWPKYRKLILDAGSKIMEVKEGDSVGCHT